MSYKLQIPLVLLNYLAVTLLTTSCIHIEPDNPARTNSIQIGFHIETAKEGQNGDNCLRVRVPRTKERLCLVKEPSLSTEDLIGAEVKTSNKNEQAFTLLFSDDGAKKLEELTGALKGKRLALVVDKKLITAPTIAAAIPGPTVTIGLKKTPYNAFTLVQKINRAVYQTADHITFHPYKEISFAPRSTQPSDTNEIKKAADWIKSYPKDSVIFVQGYFCSHDAGANYKQKVLLSICDQRAQSIKVKLVENGLEPVRITTISQGKSPDFSKCMARVMVLKPKKQN